MKKNSEFADYVLELMKPVGGVTAKRMFGGFGFFRRGKMFAILVDDSLYFKKTEKNLASIKERDLRPFTYLRKKKTVALSYYMAPAECLDDSRTMAEWVENSV